MFQKNLHLTDLVNLKEWQRIQDSLGDVLGVTLRTVSLNGELIFKANCPPRICREVLPESPNHSKFCGNCISNIGTKSFPDIEERTHFKCPLGLDIFVFPIEAVGKRAVAYTIVGPFILEKRKSASEYAKNAKKIGIEADKLTDAFIEINVFTHSAVYSIIQLLENIFSHMAQTGYHKKRLAEIIPEVAEMDPLFSKYYEEKILNALLSTCVLALNADSGSVMTLDKRTNMLHIKVSQKLDEKIVDKTNVKVGEGIAGLAAATARSIILPKDENKNGLSGKLRRKYIKSSMVIPFSKGGNQDVCGVINLNIIRKGKDFSERDIALVKELANLASAALVPLQQTD